MERTHFLILFLLLAGIILIACKSKSSRTKGNENEQMITSNLKHPFDEYPFDKSSLDPDIQISVKNFQPYITSGEIEKIIVQKNLTDANNHLCYAYFTWMDAMVTEANTDIMDFGQSALTILNQILQKDPDHSPTKKLKEYIENEMNQSVGRASKKVEQFYNIPIDKLTLEQASELAVFLSDSKSDKESKELEYKLWMRLYNEFPNVTYEKIDGVEEKFYGHKYYHLGRAADVLWKDLKKYDEARPLLWKLINWDNIEEVELYRYTDMSINYLLKEAADKNDESEFTKLVLLLQDKYKEINKYQSSLNEKKTTPIISNDTKEQLLEYALQVNNKEALKYITNAMLIEDKELGIKDKKVKEKLEKAKAVLRN